MQGNNYNQYIQMPELSVTVEKIILLLSFFQLFLCIDNLYIPYQNALLK